MILLFRDKVNPCAAVKDEIYAQAENSNSNANTNTNKNANTNKNSNKERATLFFVENRQINRSFCLIFWQGAILTFTKKYDRLEIEKLLRGKYE